MEMSKVVRAHQFTSCLTAANSWIEAVAGYVFSMEDEFREYCKEFDVDYELTYALVEAKRMASYDVQVEYLKSKNIKPKEGL